LWLFLVVSLAAQGQQFSIPLIKKHYQSLTSNAEMMHFLDSLRKTSAVIHLDTTGYSVNDKVIPLLRIQQDEVYEEKPFIYLFAQQHGDEPSGKEGLLLLAEDFAAGNLHHILDSVNVLLIPQSNPDGADQHRRRTSQDVDMNRDHLVYQAPETRVIQEVFEKYAPIVTVDIHEYYPYGASWIDFGYRRDFDIQVGTLTNPNISDSIIRYQKTKTLPYIKKHLEKSGFSFFEYTLGHFPSGERLRQSTTDINDGRQSFGITNTLSFITEGMNGKDSLHRIRERALSQYETAKAFCEFTADNLTEVKRLVSNAQSALLDTLRQKTTIRQDHFNSEDTLCYPLKNVATGEDTVFHVTNYFGDIRPLLEVEAPKGYLVPKRDTLLVALLKHNHFKYSSYKRDKRDLILGRQILEVDRVENEGIKTNYPLLMDKLMNDINPEDYFFVPVRQLRRHKVIIAFEPQSMFGIGFYDLFSGYMKKNRLFPVLRVE